MGHEEVQAPWKASEAGICLAGGEEAPQSWPVPTLARSLHANGWSDGSAVSGDVHAGFCEHPRGQFPRLTH